MYDTRPFFLSILNLSFHFITNCSDHGTFEQLQYSAFIYEKLRASCVAKSYVYLNLGALPKFVDNAYVEPVEAMIIQKDVDLLLAHIENLHPLTCIFFLLLPLF